MSSVSNKSISEKGGDARKKNNAIIIAVISVIVISVLIAIIVFLVTKNKEELVTETATEGEVEETAQREVITADNAEEAAEDFLASIPDNIPESYTVTQNGEWTFPDGASSSTDAYVMNDESNDTPVYFDLIVDETGEVVYSSPVIGLGAVLEGFKLDTPLEAGTYVCTAEYHLVDDNQNTLTTVNVGVTVNVLN